MSTESEVKLLVAVKSYLETGKGDASQLISDIGEIVQMTSKMMSSDNMWEYTVELCECDEIWNLLDELTIIAYNKQIKFSINQLRILKGIILMIRNLSIAYREKHDNISKFSHEHNDLVIKLSDYLCETYIETEDDETVRFKALDVSVVCFHCVFNFMKTSKGRDESLVRKSMKMLNLIIMKMGEIGGKFELMQILPQFKAFCMIEETRNEVKQNDCEVFINLLQTMSKILKVTVDINMEKLQDYETDEYKMILLLSDSLYYLFEDEQIGIEVYKLEKYNPEKYENSVLLYLISCQILFSKQHLSEKNDYVALGAIFLDFFNILKREVCSVLKDKNIDELKKQKLKVYHRKMIATLDIITSLLPYELFKKTLNSYDFLKELVDFFHIVEQNTQRKRLKDVENEAKLENKEDENGEKKEFGSIKTIIVEVITYLIHNDKKNQDIVRDCDGLVLLLNNCNLDVNEPFIRERCILCLKYLLENNPENQSFIANLETKGIEIDKEKEAVLEKCGYEVEIVDGKVQLKKN